MPTAAAQFFGLPELVILVAQHAFYSRSFDLLKSLRRVSRVCNAAATPYRFMELRVAKSIAETRSDGHLNPRLDLVRHAFLNFYVGLPEEEELLQDMIAQMPRLESFVYYGRPLTPALVRALEDSCPALSVLDISAYDSGSPAPRLDLERWRFRGLRELMLIHLPYAERISWLPCLAQLLRASPGLEKLGLALGRRLHAEEQQDMGLFDRLCDLYASNGGSPLSLRSLDLAGGLYPCTIASLEKLADLVYLHDVYISNEIVPTPGRIAYKAFAPPHAPNLRYFRVDYYDQAVHEHLCAITDRSFLRKLALAYRLLDWCRLVATSDLLQPSRQYPSLPLQVRMLDLELCQENLNGGRKLERHEEQVLEALVATNADTLEGLAVKTVAGGGKPTDTNHCMQLLERALPRLPNLTQLSIEAPRSTSHEDTDAVAERLALAGPRLRFINMGPRFWRVWRDLDDGSVSLEKIKTRAADRVELWKYSLINLTPLTKLDY